MGPAHIKIGPWGLWLLPGDRLYIRHVPTGEGGAFPLPDFAAEVAEWNRIAFSSKSTGTKYEAAIAKFYAERGK